MFRKVRTRQRVHPLWWVLPLLTEQDPRSEIDLTRFYPEGYGPNLTSTEVQHFVHHAAAPASPGVRRRGYGPPPDRVDAALRPGDTCGCRRDGWASNRGADPLSHPGGANRSQNEHVDNPHR